jgi:hypothetical protein
MMQDVDDLKPCFPDPIEDNVARSYEVAAQPGCKLVSRATAQWEQGEAIEAAYDAINRAIRGV